MAKSPCPFVWYELVTTDAKGAEAFYKEVVGWNAGDSGLTDRSYTILSAGKTGIGGIIELTKAQYAAGGRPGWVGYVGVDDVDAYVKKVEKAGGALAKSAENIPGVGRFAMVRDLHGAMFVLFKPLPMDEAPPRLPFGAEGTVGWHELHATDGPAAWDFYSKLFGWTTAQEMDMGAQGIYRIFAAGPEPMVGAVYTKPATEPQPEWLYYFAIDRLDRATKTVEKLGGRITVPAMQVPGDQWIAEGVDPQGARFALVANQR